MYTEIRLRKREKENVTENEKGQIGRVDSVIN